MHIYGKRKTAAIIGSKLFLEPFFLRFSIYLLSAKLCRHLMILRSYSAVVKAIKTLQKYIGFDGNTVNVAIFQITVDLKDDQPGL